MLCRRLVAFISRATSARRVPRFLPTRACRPWMRVCVRPFGFVPKMLMLDADADFRLSLFRNPQFLRPQDVAGAMTAGG